MYRSDRILGGDKALYRPVIGGDRMVSSDRRGDKALYRSDRIYLEEIKPGIVVIDTEEIKPCIVVIDTWRR